MRNGTNLCLYSVGAQCVMADMVREASEGLKALNIPLGRCYLPGTRGN